MKCKAILELKQDEFTKLLESEEYSPYLLFKDKSIYINMCTLPKTHYLPICGNYCLGLKLAWRINDLIERDGTIEIILVRLQRVEDTQ